MVSAMLGIAVVEARTTLQFVAAWGLVIHITQIASTITDFALLQHVAFVAFIAVAFVAERFALFIVLLLKIVRTALGFALALIRWDEFDFT